MSQDILLEKLAAGRARQRNVAIGQGLARTALAVLALIVGFFLVDWLILARSTPGSGDTLARGILLTAMLAALGYVVWRCLISVLLHVPDDDEVALKVERGHPELRGRLISTIQLRRDGRAIGSSDLIAALEADTVAFAGSMRFTDIIDLSMLKKVALIAAGFILLAVALGAWRSDFTRAIFARLTLAEVAYPTAARIISVSPGQLVARGEPFVVSIELDPTGDLPERASATLTDADGHTSEIILARENPTGVVYIGTIDHVLSNMTFRPAAGDALWNRHESITVVDRPAIKNLSLAYRFPEYLRRQNETSAVGDIRAPEGSHVTLAARFNRPVIAAQLIRRINKIDQPPLDLMLGDNGASGIIDLPVEVSGSYRLLLRCDDGFDNRNPIDYVIDAVKDRSPTVKISFPARDKTVTRFARWPVKFNARDDHGVAKGRLKYTITTGDEALAAANAVFDVDHQPSAQVLELAGLVKGSASSEISGEIVFDLRTLTIPNDCRITYWIEVEDNRTPTANRAVSSQYAFTVVDAAVLEEMLERDRAAMVDSLKLIRDKQKDARDAVDTLRRDVNDPPATEPAK